LPVENAEFDKAGSTKKFRRNVMFRKSRLWAKKRSCRKA
jgi:hypothetical protein